MIPDSRMPRQTAHAIHLHSDSSSGGKDWVGVVSHDPMIGGKLWVLNGKTKEVLSGGGQGRAVAAKGTEQALADAARKKVNEGYILVDEYQARNGCWDSQKSQPPRPVKTAAPTPYPQVDPPSPPPAVVKPPAPILSNSDGKDSEPTMCW